MARGRATVLPIRMYDFLKERAKVKETDMKTEAGKMFDRYLKLRGLEKRLEGKKVLVFGK